MVSKSVRPVLAWARLLSLAALSLVFACGAPNGGAPSETTGTMSLALRSALNNGYAYELRDARFSVAGPDGSIVSELASGDQPPEATALTTVLPTGNYEVLLESEPTWELWRVSETEEVQVEATLTSPNPQGFAITSGATTSVPFRFDTEGTEVVFDTGSLVIAIEVEEVPAGSQGPCGDGVLAPLAGEQCDDGNLAGADGCTRDCQMELGYVCSLSPSVCLPTEFLVAPGDELVMFESAFGRDSLVPTTGSLELSLTAPLSASADADACNFLPFDSLTGKAALIQRGVCSFGTKARNALLAGAAAVVIVNNGPGLLGMTISIEHADVTIPIVSVSQADGIALSALMAQGPVTLTWLDPAR